MGNKKNYFWGIIFVVLAVLSIWAVSSGGNGLTFGELIDDLKHAQSLYLFLAVLSSAGFIWFEGEALLAIIKHVGYQRKRVRGMLYSAADVYFSAITPSATGGQPASAFFMIRDGIPTAIATAALVLNLVMYTMAILFLGVLAFLVKPGLFLGFSLFSRLLIIAGFVTLAGLGAGFFLLLYKPQFLFGTVRKVLRGLYRIHLVRNPQKHLDKLTKTQKDYSDCVRIMSGSRTIWIKAFVFNLLQRLSQIMVTIMVYLATGGPLSGVKDLFVTQIMVVLGSNCVPIPGAMGVADMLMLDGYTQLFSKDYAYRLELIGRSLSFYCCIIISAAMVLIGYLLLKKNGGKHDRGL